METVQPPINNNTSLTDREWFDLAWKYFQQHSQQRMLHFNYFIVFSTILTSGLIATFQNNFSFFYIRLLIGSVQAFLSFFFAKLDERTNFLIKHAENVIKSYELNCAFPLFIKEETFTSIKVGAKGVWGISMMTHGQLYRIAYKLFFMLGLCELLLFFIDK